ncbi:MAG: polyprenyl synthetase family protein [Thermoleophilia bacterium]|nr:polyprenyl synthetase family protein [Thermoleophilia bacterium]
MSTVHARYPEHLRVRVDEYLDGLRFDVADPAEAAEARGTEGLAAAMRYSLLAGGKRIRPVLALATAEALGRDPADLMPAAAAIELVHTYSLIHDDLPAMDDDDLRRGLPTCHVTYGEDVAILAGDALFAEAVRLVCEEQGGGPAVQVGILRELSRATGVAGMVGGQYLDLKGAGVGGAEALAAMHALKTGRLMAVSVHVALVLAPPPPAQDVIYRAFAREVGLLFQIVDDILDVAGSEEELGKAVGADERMGKVTYTSLHGMDRARDLAAESRARALELLGHLDGPVDDLAAIADTAFSRQS